MGEQRSYRKEGKKEDIPHLEKSFSTILLLCMQYNHGKYWKPEKKYPDMDGLKKKRMGTDAQRMYGISKNCIDLIFRQQYS